MPILRKVIEHGDSRGVTLPASWITLIERESGKKLNEVTMEVNGSIIIKPFLGAADAADSSK
jgi:hypothetical protein